MGWRALACTSVIARSACLYVCWQQYILHALWILVAALHEGRVLFPDCQTHRSKHGMTVQELHAHAKVPILVTSHKHVEVYYCLTPYLYVPLA